ncbi:MAG: hypothetical protein WBW13_16555, partial [Pseudolabrys sp.]
FLLQTWIGNPDSQYEVAHTAQGLFAPDILTPDGAADAPAAMAGPMAGLSLHTPSIVYPAARG